MKTESAWVAWRAGATASTSQGPHRQQRICAGDAALLGHAQQCSLHDVRHRGHVRPCERQACALGMQGAQRRARLVATAAVP